MSWYKIIKQSRFQGATEPIMDYYSKGERPSSSNYKKDPRSLVNAIPEFGGNGREGYPDDLNSFKPTEDYKNRRRIPGENVLMDQDPPTGEGVNKDQYVDEADKLPKGLDNNSVRLDRGLSPIPKKKNLYKNIRDKTKIRSFNNI